MGPDLDARYPGEGAVVHEGESATGLDTVAELLFATPLLDVGAARVAECNANRAALGRSLLQELVESRVRLVQEDGGVDQHIDLLARLAQQVHEGGHGDIRPLVVESHKLWADGTGGACLPERRPQSMHVFS